MASTSTQTIGSYSFVSMAGQVGAFSSAIQDLSRPGVDGHAFRDIGKRGDRFMIQTISTVSSIADAISLVDSYNKLIGTFQPVEHGYISILQVIIHNVKCNIMEISAATNSHSYMVSTMWEMQRTKD